MGTAGFSNIRTCDSRLGTTSATTVSTGMSFLMSAAGVSIFMASAGMPFFVVMVITVCSCRNQFTFQICFYNIIGVSLCTGNHLDSSLCECCLSASADTTADQNVDTLLCQKACQCAVSSSVGTDHFTGNYFVVFHFINFKRLCFSKMLKNLSIIVCYCNFHLKNPPNYFLYPFSPV